MRVSRSLALWALLLSFTCSGPVLAQGTYIGYAGPVSQGMAGASTAAPIDAIGSTYWNPASISAVQPELGFGVGLLLAELETTSSVAGLGGGTTEAEPGVTAIPTVGWVHRSEGSPITIGLGVHAVAGFKTNYPSSATNPIFTPQSNAAATPGGFGRVMTQAAFLQLAPMFSYAVTENLSVGVGPTVTLAELTIDPLVFAAPDDADGSGAARYPSGRGTRVHWGGGAQVGVYYITDNCVHLGMSVKSPQWMEDIRYKTENERGLPRVAKVPLELPMIISAGAAYSGIENVVVAMDVRYLDYKNTDFWGPHGFRADGSLAGLGMSSVFSVATGAQVRLTETLYARAGYTYNQNPYQGNESAAAVGAPLQYQHQVHVGGSRKLSDVVAVNMAYSYFFESEVTGPIVTAAGTIPGSNLTTREHVHFLTFGVSVQY